MFAELSLGYNVLRDDSCRRYRTSWSRHLVGLPRQLLPQVLPQLFRLTRTGNHPGCRSSVARQITGYEDYAVVFLWGLFLKDRGGIRGGKNQYFQSFRSERSKEGWQKSSEISLIHKLITPLRVDWIWSSVVVSFQWSCWAFCSWSQVLADQGATVVREQRCPRGSDHTVQSLTV